MTYAIEARDLYYTYEDGTSASRWVSSFRTRMTSFFPPTYIVTSHLEA